MSITYMRSRVLQRCTATQECDDCRSKRLGLQRRNGSGREPASVPPIVHEVLRSPGQALEASTRALMEPRLGHDFSQVRIHNDARAAESALAVNALAYTVGRDVVFGSGQYLPRSATGQRLLAHELTHVVQQENARPSAWTKLEITTPENPAEREAETASHAITEGQPFHATSGQTIQIARQQPPVQGPAGGALPGQGAIPGVLPPGAEAGAQPAAAQCPVPDLAPITDPDAQAMEGGARVIWNHTVQGLQDAANKLVSLIEGQDGKADIESAYRPQAYQDHLRNVWDTARALRGNATPACADLRKRVDQEMANHQLSVNRPVGKNSNHTDGTAVDIDWSLPKPDDKDNGIDALAQKAGLSRPIPDSDPIHFVK